MSNDPKFGEREGQHHPKASCAVFVRRQLNEYSPFEEVFEFYHTEPEVGSKRNGAAACKYYITRESRTGRPGVDEIEASGGMIPIQTIPEEVRERAAAMVDYIETNPDWEDDEE